MFCPNSLPCPVCPPTTPLTKCWLSNCVAFEPTLCFTLLWYLIYSNSIDLSQFLAFTSQTLLDLGACCSWTTTGASASSLSSYSAHAHFRLLPCRTLPVSTHERGFLWKVFLYPDLLILNQATKQVSLSQNGSELIDMQLIQFQQVIHACKSVMCLMPFRAGQFGLKITLDWVRKPNIRIFLRKSSLLYQYCYNIF